MERSAFVGAFFFFLSLLCLWLLDHDNDHTEVTVHHFFFIELLHDTVEKPAGIYLVYLVSYIY